MKPRACHRHNCFKTGSTIAHEYGDGMASLPPHQIKNIVPNCSENLSKCLQDDGKVLFTLTASEISVVSLFSCLTVDGVQQRDVTVMDKTRHNVDCSQL